MIIRMMARPAAALALGAAIALGAGLPAEAAGLLTPRNGGPALDLRDQHVDVVVEDGYAVTTIEQVFANPLATDEEAIYSFPVPLAAAVSEFTYWIDGNPVTAEVLEKQEARRIYEGEKQAGRETGLTEQDGHKTFDIAVWPVRANADVRIRLAYIQPAGLETGIGRYVYPLEEGGVDEAKLAFWTANETVSGAFSFDLHMRTDYTIEALRLPKHPGAAITQEADGSWRVHLDNGMAAAPPAPAGDAASAPASLAPANAAPATTPASATPAAAPASTAAAPADGAEAPASAAAQQPFRLDTDIVVYWREAASEPARVDMVAYKPDASGRGTFMLTLTPGMDLKPITEGRDWVFVLDRSGSMGGKIGTLSEGVSRALGKLRPEDRFRIVYFNDQAEELTHGFTPVTREAVEQAVAWARQVQAEGGTDLYAGLKMGLDALDADRTGAVILVTDGEANVGNTETRDFLKLTQAKDVRLFTAIMGNSANTPLLQPMTLASGGFAVSVSNSDDIVGVLLDATSKVTHEALHGVKLAIDPAGASLRIDDIRRDDIRTLYRGEQLVLFGHYWGDGDAALKLTGAISGKPVSFDTRFAFPATATRDPELERLWAFAEIEQQLQKIALFGEDADVELSVVDTSKAYGILSPYTSMLVVRDERFQELAIGRANRDRLAAETTARETRAGQPVQSVRADRGQPMFSSPAPRHSGGSGGGSGDFGLPGLLLALLVLAGALRARRPAAA